MAWTLATIVRSQTRSGLLPRLVEQRIVLGSSLASSWLATIGSLPYPMTPQRRTQSPHYLRDLLHRRCPQQRRKGIHHLQRTLETHLQRQQATFLRGSGYLTPQQVVRQQMRPHLLVHHLRRLATQNVHLQSLLQRPQVQLDLPAIMPPKREAYNSPRRALRR